jgi:lactate permease
MACVGHGWAVNFGSMAISFQTLMAVTNLPGTYLAPDAAILSGIACVFCGSLVALLAGGWKGLKRTIFFILPVGLVIAVTQFSLATHKMWVVGTTGAVIAGILFSLVFLRLPYYQRMENLHNISTESIHAAQNPGVSSCRRRSLPVALSVYIVLMALTFTLNLVTPVNEFISRVRFELPFPELSSATGWVTPAEMGRSINVFGHPGSILFYSSLIAFLIYQRAGYYQPGAFFRILKRVIRGAVNSSLGIISMVGMAVVMSHTGMTNILAEGLSHVFGAAFYPVSAPFIGALGAFITGSNNNSNVLFAVLQMRAAQLLSLRVPLILGAQTIGGSLGSIMAPTKVIVGCSTVGLGDREGLVMRKVVVYGIIPVVVIAVVTVLLAWSQAV